MTFNSRVAAAILFAAPVLCFAQQVPQKAAAQENPQPPPPGRVFAQQPNAHVIQAKFQVLLQRQTAAINQLAAEVKALEARVAKLEVKDGAERE